MRSILFIVLLALPLALAPAQASGASVSVAMDAESYSVADTATGSAPVATIRVTDSAGLGLAGVEVRVVFIRQVALVGFVGNETVMGQTDADGVLSVAAPTASGLPGNYVVAAYALGSTASDRYSVGA